MSTGWAAQRSKDGGLVPVDVLVVRVSSSGDGAGAVFARCMGNICAADGEQGVVTGRSSIGVPIPVVSGGLVEHYPMPGL